MPKQPELKHVLARLIVKAGSERRAATLVDVSNTAYNDWMKGRSYPSEEKALRIAKELDLPREFIVALVNFERAKTPVLKELWWKILDQMKDAAVIAIMAIGAASLGGFNNSSFASPLAPQVGADNTHCMPKRRRWWEVLL